METTDYKPSTDMQLPTDHAELERFAKAWIDTAAFHLRNEEYWRERCKQAEIELGKGDLWIEYPPNDKPVNIDS
jgi:hypothetical protein